MAMLVYRSVVIPLNPHLLLLAFSLFFAEGPCPAKRNHPAVAQKAAKKPMENSTSTHFSTKYYGNQQIPKLLPSCDLDQKHCWPHIPHLAPWVAGLSQKKNPADNGHFGHSTIFVTQNGPRCHGREQSSMQIFSSGNLSTHQGEKVSHEK